MEFGSRSIAVILRQRGDRTPISPNTARDDSAERRVALQGLITLGGEAR